MLTVSLCKKKRRKKMARFTLYPFEFSINAKLDAAGCSNKQSLES